MDKEKKLQIQGKFYIKTQSGIKRIRWVCILMLIVLILSSGTIVCASEADRSSRVVKVGWFLLDGLQEQDEEGHCGGYNYEYLRTIAQYTDWQYEFVTGTVSECLQMVEDGELDLIGGIARTDDRAGKLLYAEQAEGNGGSRIICREEDSRYAYHDIEGLAGAVIGTIDAANQLQVLQKILEDNQVQVNFQTFDTQEEMLQGLNDGVVDAALVSQTQAASGYRVVLDYAPEPFYFAVNKNRSDLITELNEAVSRIQSCNSSFESDLYSRYYQNAESLHLAFTREEREYLESDKELLVAYDPSWYPIEYKNSLTGEYTGIMSGVFDLVSESTGLNFQFVTADSFADVIKEYGDEADLISGLTYDYSWGDELEFKVTQPLFKVQLYQLYQGSPKINGTIALPEGYYIATMIQERYGDTMSYTFYKTIEDCVNAVRKGKADITVVNDYELMYYCSMPKNSTLNFSSIRGCYQNISVGVSKNADPYVYSIISKAISNISEDEMLQILSENNTNFRTTHTVTPLDLVYLNPIGALCICLGLATLVFMLFYVQKRNRLTHIKNEELAASNASLEQANAAKTDFLSRMSHDIRTPMNAIIGLTTLTLEKDNLSPEVKDNLENIQASGTFLLGLVNDILDMSKIEAGAMTLHREPYGYQEFVKTLRTIFIPQCEKKGIQVTFAEPSAEEKTYFVLTDSLRINQIFFNIFANAVKYTPKGGRISYYVENEVKTDQILSADYVVEDTGIGMSEEFLSRIFKPFEQEDNSYTAALQGTGLGLSIAGNLAEQLGGSISIKSRQNQGTKVSIHLELERVNVKDTASHTLMTAEQDQAQYLQGKHILLVEDNLLNTTIARKMLEKKGMVVTHAENGQIALELFEESEENAFDAILMDIRMPLMDGLQATKSIRNLKCTDAKEVPIVAMTANAYEEDRRASLEAGMNEHLAKPVNPQELFRILEACMKERDAKVILRQKKMKSENNG